MSLFGKNQRESATRGEPLGARPPNMPRGQAGEPARADNPSPAPPPVRRPEGEANRMANIGKSIQIKGDLTGNEDLVVEGKVEGRIDLPNNQLTIGAEGQVKADLHAKTVVVVGHVTGNVSAAERVEVQATGVVDGDVKAPRLIVQEGAVLNGAVDMGANAKPSSAVDPKPQAKAAGEAA